MSALFPIFSNTFSNWKTTWNSVFFPISIPMVFSLPSVEKNWKNGFRANSSNWKTRTARKSMKQKYPIWNRDTPLSQQTISIPFTEQEWMMIGAAIVQALQNSPPLIDRPEDGRAYLKIGERITQTLNRRLRETGSGDIVVNFTNKQYVSAKDLYGE
jgi:hypothetical protein